MQHPCRLIAIGIWISGWLSTLLWPASLLAAYATDAVSAVQSLREGGCGGTSPAMTALHHEAALDRAAAEWANGISLAAAVHDNGYPADMLSGLHVSSPESSVVQLLRRSSCRTVTDHRLHDLGVYHRGVETWFLLASAVPALLPPISTSPSLAARALQLVNTIRAHGTRCGERFYGPAPPVRLSVTLNEVALGHAADMARRDYFEHNDFSGHTPADRVRAVGYRETLVGENIAYGPASADEVIRGWLDSPGHCENIMDSRFAEMGIAYSPGLVSRRGLYWVQLLAAPKA